MFSLSDSAKLFFAGGKLLSAGASEMSFDAMLLSLLLIGSGARRLGASAGTFCGLTAALKSRRSSGTLYSSTVSRSLVADETRDDGLFFQRCTHEGTSSAQWRTSVIVISARARAVA